ncbi:MAG: hypothetical protein ACE366_02365 [Bradymonadia bacterium]
MSINVNIPLEAMQKPGVAEALARLVSCLGGHAAPAAAAPKVEPAVKQVSLGAEYMAAAAAPAEAAPAKPAKKPRKPRKRAEPKPDPAAQEIAGLSDDERYDKWFNQLPDNSKKFLEELEKAGSLTLSEAVEILELSSPRGMGGLTGSMKRWAKRYGITKLPFLAARNENTEERYWTWQGR